MNEKNLAQESPNSVLKGSESIIIIGGGVIGLCCALYLNREGFKVIVVEKNDISNGCSFGNMGYVSPSHFTPLATPGIVAQGLKWMMNSSSPFYIKPRLNWDLLRWGITFYNNANANRIRKNIPHLNNLLQLSRMLMGELKHELSFSLTEKGCWMLYKNQKTGDHEKRLADEANKLELKTIICDQSQVQSYEQETKVDVTGGVLYLDDCYVNPAELMKVLYTRLKNEGVEFYLNTDVTGFEYTNERINAVITDKQKIQAGEIIIANGSWLPQLSKKLGINILLQPGKGYSYIYNNLKNNLQYPSILVDDRVATTPYGDRLRIGGTMELTGHSNDILPKRLIAIYDAFKKYYPLMAIQPPDINKAWYGYRPVTPDGLPYIGRHRKFINLTYAGGHAMLGVSAAAGTGKLISDIIANTKTTIDVTAFYPQRFG
jgi:D-amino-acid dehydrogenase